MRRGAAGPARSSQRQPASTQGNDGGAISGLSCAKRGAPTSALINGVILAGVALVMMRMSSRRWLARMAATYVTAIRGTPALAQLFFIYFGLAELGLVEERQALDY